MVGPGIYEAHTGEVIDVLGLGKHKKTEELLVVGRISGKSFILIPYMEFIGNTKKGKRVIENYIRQGE